MVFGIHQVQIRPGDIGFYQAVDLGDVPAGDAAEDVVDGVRPGERRRPTSLHVELREAVEQVAADCLAQRAGNLEIWPYQRLARTE